MPRLLEGLLPKAANNDYQGHKVALWAFALMTTITVVRSVVHIVKYDGGAQSIATIPLDTYTQEGAATVIAMFALWGVSQLLIGVFYTVVLMRYRTLIPLMYLSLLIEYVLRFVVTHYKTIETVGQAPGAISNMILPPLMLVMLYLSLPGKPQFESNVRK